MSACEPLCAILLSRVGQNPREAVCAKMRRVTRDERNSRRKPWRFPRARAGTSARSAGSCGDEG